jgi:mRNA-degrading endonuclease RelE of RelBE toxin-antitoxin system
MYKIIFLDEVKKDLDKIDNSIKNHIFKKLQQLAINPQI